MAVAVERLYAAPILFRARRDLALESGNERTRGAYIQYIRILLSESAPNERALFSCAGGGGEKIVVPTSKPTCRVYYFVCARVVVLWEGNQFLAPPVLQNTLCIHTYIHPHHHPQPHEITVLY
jgi:hypothetical protein